MKRLNFSTLLVLAFLTAFSFSTSKAQEEFANSQPENARQNRPRLLAALGLTPEQIQIIRRINRENRPQLREANLRLREANRNLDAAIYGDNADESEIKMRVKEVHAAHAEAVKIRAQTEFAVRKVLTPEQLFKFREIRQQSFLEKENLQKLRNNRRMNDNPNRPLNNRLRRNRPLN